VITLEKVSFTYRSGQRALQDIDLTRVEDAASSLGGMMSQ